MVFSGGGKVGSYDDDYIERNGFGNWSWDERGDRDDIHRCTTSSETSC